MLAPSAIFGGVIFILLIQLLRIGHRPKNYPPGPPTIPILGNIHQIPSRDVHLQFEKWARQYGPVYSLILGTKTLIVLSSDSAVKSLLDKKSAIYSDRPEIYIGQDLASGGLRLLMMNYSDRWRTVGVFAILAHDIRPTFKQFRKMIHQLLNISSAKSYVPYQVLENKQMLYEMLVEPDDFRNHIRRYSNALTTTMVFGWRTPTYEDAKMKQLFEGFSEFAHLNATGVAAVIDFFPVLRRLPDFIFWTAREAKRLHAREKALYLSHWLAAKDAIEKGTIPPCFCVGMAAAQKSLGFSDDQASYISGTLLEAGSDTTTSTLYAFVQAMLLYPDVQRKAQKQLDAIVGDRMPAMDDEQNLPYVRACMKEVLRWMPTTILGAVPHAVTQDDYYEGYLIPRGAGVVNNVWGIHMDPQRHPEPRKFIPERYENDYQSLLDAANNPDPSKRDQFSFGAGRRICPGIHVAERSLFLGISRMLWAFEISPKLDDDGQPILPDPDKLTQGFVVLPVDFPARIMPRSAARAETVRREWDEAQAESLDPKTKQWIATPPELQNITSKFIS